MIEAKVIKAAVVQTGSLPVISGVAEYEDMLINFNAKYRWEELDHEQFIVDLRDKIAESFDIPVYHVDMNPELLMGKMYQHFIKQQDNQLSKDLGLL